MFENMEVKEWLQLNAKLQRKKSAMRKELSDRGILKRGGRNKYDNYSYTTESQYKELANELLPSFGLEVKFNEISYELYAGTEKQANGRIVKLEYDLFDVETGFFESSTSSGEGIDKGDKAGYKAYTGAFKYFFANTFMVATGDDPEKESPNYPMNDKLSEKASAAQVKVLNGYYAGENLEKLLRYNGIKKLEDISAVKARELIEKIQKKQDEDFFEGETK